MAGSANWSTSGIRHEYTLRLADPFTLQDVDTLSEVDFGSCTMTWGYYTDNILQGSLALSSGSWMRDGRMLLARVYDHVTGPGIDHDACLGTMFVDSAPETAKFGLVSSKLACYSTLWRFTKDVLVYDFFRKQGYNVVKAIRDIVEADGGHLRVLDGVDTGRTFGGWIFFELGTNRATVINTIAGWIDCQIGVDDQGYVTIGPYVEPSRKPVVYTFEEGVNCVCKPGATRSRDTSSPINRVVMYYSRDEDTEGDGLPLTDRVMLALDPDDEFSYERCGRRRSEVVKLDQPVAHSDLEAKARTYLSENSASSTTIEIEHVGVPTLRPGDVVRYINKKDFDAPVNVRCLVSDIDSTLDLWMTTKTKLKVIE